MTQSSRICEDTIAKDQHVTVNLRKTGGDALLEASTW